MLVFEHREWLAALAAIPLVWGVARYGRILPRGRRVVVCAVLRSLVLALAIVALAEPGIVKGKAQQAVQLFALVVDKSLSLQSDEDELLRRVESFRSALGEAGRVEQTAFARTACPADESATLDTGDTNIELGLEKARVSFAGSAFGAVVLFSDGRATTGDSVRAAERLRVQGIPVHTVAVGKPNERGPRIVGVEPPSRARLGQPATFRVRVHCEDRSEIDLRLVDAAKREVDRVMTTVEGDAVLVVRMIPKEEGFQDCGVYLEGAAGGGTQTYAAAPVFVEGSPCVLMIDTVAAESEVLRFAVSSLNLRVDVQSCDKPLPEYDKLVAYDAVVLNDCSALTEATQGELVLYVERAGGGLLFICGGNVRARQWHDSPLELAMPIVFLPEQMKVVQKNEPVHVCFVLDKSGSMSSPLGNSSAGVVSKLDMVKAAVHASVAELPSNAIVSVVVFDAATVVLVREATVSEWAGKAEDLDRLAADGGTVMDMAMEQAIELLSSKPHAYMILLTDGQTNIAKGHSPQVRWDELITRTRAERIRLAAIGLGSDADRYLLDYLADGTGGTQYYCDHADDIPKVFIQEAQTIKQLARSETKTFFPLGGPALSMLRGLPINSFPQLERSLPAQQKDTAQIVLTTERQQPLLALWHYGFGTVAAFTSDAKPAWARQWVGWKPFGRFWSQVLSWCLRSENDLEAEVEPIVDGNSVRLLVKIAGNDGKPMSRLAPVGRLCPADRKDGPIAELTWREVRPGVYEGSGMLDGQGNSLCRLEFRAENRAVFSHAMLLRPSGASETAQTGADLESLVAIAVAGGGQHNPSPKQVLASVKPPSVEPPPVTQPLWPPLVLAAMIIWMIDVAVRRFAVGVDAEQAGSDG